MEAGKNDKSAVEQELSKLEAERDSIKDERASHERYKQEMTEKLEMSKAEWKKKEDELGDDLRIAQNELRSLRNEINRDKEA